MTYLWLKTVHVLSATVLFGTGVGSMYYFFRANRSGEPRLIAATARHLVLADWVFTTPAAVVQPVTGLWMLSLSGVPLSSRWVWASLMLFVYVGACWIPAVVLQLRMRRMAESALEAGGLLPPAYAVYLRIWIGLGVLALPAMLAIFWLMVAKPS